MWKCKDCDEIFDEPGYPEDDAIICPICGGDDFCEYHQCGECFEKIPEDEEYCEQCIEKVKRIVEDATDSFDRELRDLVLERILEG